MCVVMELFSIFTTSNTGRTRPEYKLYGLEIIVAFTSIHGDISSLITSATRSQRQPNVFDPCSFVSMLTLKVSCPFYEIWHMHIADKE